MLRAGRKTLRHPRLLQGLPGHGRRWAVADQACTPAIVHKSPSHAKLLPGLVMPCNQMTAVGGGQQPVAGYLPAVLIS